jgi:hypothetical protein
MFLAVLEMKMKNAIYGSARIAVGDLSLYKKTSE